ncbi:hypothetical protein LWP59_12625 [Amycolatopsis acidiphila]|uniref:hypothetical protein n=1 Tax=Amycolatopsis acidiphila TaxID=715473 RepID=UPI001991B990|nr:hypothetical protein [Amycolatopsis acidiphila]UIJ62397.1 hypothetical protein LWP59_12625 [Amycolatopsis acidiphila]GHG83469.1 hypothetical protein GCM10017788_54590 [Amycolatopsis acidiphila]
MLLLHPAPLPARLQFRLLYFYEHESTDSGLQGASDEVWVSGTGMDSAAVTVGPDRRPVAETITSQIVGDVSDDRVRDGWRENPHVLLEFDLRRQSDWPRTFTTTLMLIEEDSGDVKESFDKLEAAVGKEVKLAAVTAAGVAGGALAGAALGSVVPGIGTAVGAAVGAIAVGVYDDVVKAIKEGLDNEAFTPVPLTLTVADPAAITRQPGIGTPQKVQIQEHGARYEVEYDWHLVG